MPISIADILKDLIRMYDSLYLHIRNVFNWLMTPYYFPPLIGGALGGLSIAPFELLFGSLVGAYLVIKITRWITGIIT